MAREIPPELRTTDPAEELRNKDEYAHAARFMELAQAINTTILDYAQSVGLDEAKLIPLANAVEQQIFAEACEILKLSAEARDYAIKEVAG